MTAPEPVRFGCLLPPCAVGDLPVVEAILSGYVRAAARRGEIELAEGWQLVEVRTEVRRSQFNNSQAAWAFGTVLGARKPSPPAGDI